MVAVTHTMYAFCEGEGDGTPEPASNDQGHTSHLDEDGLSGKTCRGSNTLASNKPSFSSSNVATQTHHDDFTHHDIEKAEPNSSSGSPLDPLPGSAKPHDSTLTHILSRTSFCTSTHLKPGPAPDGGWTAWSQSIGVHLVIFSTWGYVNSFGLFQTYYSTSLVPARSASDIAWIGSVQVWLLFFIGTFSGRLTDAGYFRPVFLCGCAMQLLGTFTASAAGGSYWQLFLSQGVVTGIANGLLFCPCLSLLASYFSKHRAVALGLAASGSATGGMVLPAMVETLLPRIGFGWTIRALAFLMLGIQVVCFILLKPRLPPRKSGPYIEWAAFRELPYTFFTVGMFLIFWGIYTAFYFVGEFGIDTLGISKSASINILLMMNGVGIIGRMVPAWLADRYFGPLNSLLPFVLVSGILCYCWTAVASIPGLYTWVVMYGLFAAGIQSLFPATLSSLTTNPQKLGVRMGMVFTIISIATLTGTPIAGVLISLKGGQYQYAQILAGTTLLAGFVALGYARYSRHGFKRGKM